MAKRGFFAEMSHQKQVAARQREQANKAAARQHAAAVRQAEAAQRQAEQARARAAKASAAHQKQAEAEAKRLYLEARAAEVEALNTQLAETYDELDTLLASTLDVDDHVDLEALRVHAEHPPFGFPELEVPIPPPPPVQPPPEPQWVEPAAPTGLSGALGGKKRHEQTRLALWAQFQEQHQAWQAHAAQVPTLQLQQMQGYQVAEAQRQEQLAAARRDYENGYAERDAVAAQSNVALDELIAGLEIGAASAVNEYISIVLGNSAYPEVFPVEHDFDFDPEFKELTLRVSVPGPDDLPKIKAYNYTKSSEEITSTDLPAKALKDRYSSVLHQVALRTLHEVFEADRRRCVETISLTVSTTGVDAATGLPTTTPLVAVATDRATFEPIDLSLVVPAATLEHLGALVSKNPYGLVAIDTSKGVRGK